MNIIKAGVLPINRLIKLRCEMCDTIFTAEIHEFKPNPQPEESSQFVICPLPECGHQCWDYEGDEVPVNPEDEDNY